MYFKGHSGLFGDLCVGNLNGSGTAPGTCRHLRVHLGFFTGLIIVFTDLVPATLSHRSSLLLCFFPLYYGQYRLLTVTSLLCLVLSAAFELPCLRWASTEFCVVICSVPLTHSRPPPVVSAKRAIDAQNPKKLRILCKISESSEVFRICDKN